MTRFQITCIFGVIAVVVVVILLAYRDHAIRQEYRRWAAALPVQKVDREACLRRKEASAHLYFNYRVLCDDFVAAPPPEEIPPSNLWEAIVRH